jgi:hypothetical protein
MHKEYPECDPLAEGVYPLARTPQEASAVALTFVLVMQRAIIAFGEETYARPDLDGEAKLVAFDRFVAKLVAEAKDVPIDNFSEEIEAVAKRTVLRLIGTVSREPRHRLAAAA